MEDPQLVGRLLETVRVALDRVRDPALDVDPSFIEKLDAYREELERRLGILVGSAATTAPPPRPSGPIPVPAGIPRAMPEAR